MRALAIGSLVVDPPIEIEVTTSFCDDRLLHPIEPANSLTTRGERIVVMIELNPDHPTVLAVYLFDQTDHSLECTWGRITAHLECGLTLGPTHPDPAITEAIAVALAIIDIFEGFLRVHVKITHDLIAVILLDGRTMIPRQVLARPVDPTIVAFKAFEEV